MARQTGILKFSGPLGGLSFYNHKHYGMLVRKSNPVSAERMRTDPAFQRTMENSSEFGRTSKAAKLLRHALRGFLHDIGTTFLDNRTMQYMLAIKNKDLISPRGQRCPAQALTQNPALLGGFELHATQTLGTYLKQAPRINANTGTISWSALTIQSAPAKATHVRFTALRGRLDFQNGTQDIRISENQTIPLNNQAANLVLGMMQPQALTGTEIWGIKIIFLQEINGQFYPLQIGAAQLLQSNAIPVAEIHIAQHLSTTPIHHPIALKQAGKHSNYKNKHAEPESG